MHETVLFYYFGGGKDKLIDYLVTDEFLFML